MLRQQVIDRPSIALWCGPRGGGKSYVSGLGTWINSQLHDHYGTKILGGSLAQSKQVYEALQMFERSLPVHSSPLVARGLTKQKATFRTGSEVEILAASPTSVRGPHVQDLKLDEVDEIDADIRESAFGMAMELRGIRSSVLMTSTWHRVGGPMAGLMEKGHAGAFPTHTFCAWEILERCPDSRSGPNLENCPECPLVQWCHADRDQHPSGLPKAKRSDGHYAIDSLIQKTKGVSLRVFESDYLCGPPRAAGMWFTMWDLGLHVRESAEYDPALPVHCSIDSGVFTGAVLFQARRVPGEPTWDVFRGARPGPEGVRITVFADYLNEGSTAEVNARAILALIDERCGEARSRGLLRVSTDSAGGARNPVGRTVLEEYLAVGLRGRTGLECWPKHAGSVQDGLALVEALLKSADGTVSLTVHPRCERLIAAFGGYVRAKLAGQWRDYPADPQHFAEDMIDALRGGLKVEMPDSKRLSTPMNTVSSRRVF